jgi:hypothetical protein
MIKIDFEFETTYGVFRDALHLPEGHGFTEEEIAAMKQQRLDNWLAVVTAPSQEEEVVNTIEINGETYTRLEGTPPSGAKVIEVENIWYYKD